MSDYYEIEPAASAPVTLDEAKKWLKIRSGVTVDDTLIEGLISAATAWGETYTNRVFVESIFYGYFDCTQTSLYEKYPYVHIRRAPLNSIESVEVQTGGIYTSFTGYVLKQSNSFARLLFPEGIEADEDSIYPLKVSFKAGYSPAPEALKTAVLSHIAFLYENRGDAVAEGKIHAPLESSAIYRKYRILNTFG